MAAVGNLSRILREEHGVRPGDRVGVFAANSLEWVIAFWATLASGAVATAMNSYWSEPETQAALQLTTPSIVMADERRAAMVGGAPVLKLDAALYHRITSELAADPVTPDTHEDDPAILLFTSPRQARRRPSCIPTAP